MSIPTQTHPNQAQYWEQRYLQNETGWDMHQVSPPLKNYIDTIEDKNINILIPGCGNAYEAQYLWELGFKNITLIDIAETPVKRLQEKFAHQPIQIFHQDFFIHQGSYQLILEQTFFCAIDPLLRPAYAEKCAQLLAPAGILAGLLFNTEFEKEGPPFGGHQKEYRKYFEPYFKFLQFDVCTTTIPPRMGKELFIMLQKK